VVTHHRDHDHTTKPSTSFSSPTLVFQFTEIITIEQVTRA
jgi:hypothetical protein